ncbi:MAG: hypothetical protein IPO92_15810 [Saprospiraceae bacterium]|nr:hypothetical protein [Saprospiraceae bacterium]
MPLKVIFLGFICSLAINADCQSHYLLDNFKAYKESNRVVLNWTVKKGNTCSGTGILRSTDNINFEVIGEISGICGSQETAKSYSFIDENPVKNKINYYVLELGFSGKTEPSLAIKYLDVSTNGYLLYPNPIDDIGYLYFNNVNNSKHTLRINDASGKYYPTYTTNSDVFTLIFPTNPDYLPSHIIYWQSLLVFTILNESGEIVASGKFIKK